MTDTPNYMLEPEKGRKGVGRHKRVSDGEIEGTGEKTADTPNYVLKTHSSVLKPVKERKAVTITRNCLWVVLGILTVGSLVLRVNLYMELNIVAKVLLGVLIIRYLYRGKEYKPIPMELQFYDDYLIVYFPERWYSNRYTRKEINKLKYKDITRCVIKTEDERVHIYGSGESIWYKFRKDGTVPEEPDKVRKYEGGLVYFGTQFLNGINIKEVIESHSPLEVEVEGDIGQFEGQNNTEEN